MASSSSSSFFQYVLFCYFALTLISFSLEKTLAHAAAETNFHAFEISEILPSTSCKPSSSKGPGSKSSLKVVDRNGACSGESNKLSLVQILDHDQSRVASIQSRLDDTSSRTTTKGIGEKKTKIPAKYGAPLASGNYIATIGIGTPKQYYNLIFDTGSDLTWTQCQPCVRYCYPQQDPIFNPSQSSTYSNISCNSPQCDLLLSGTGNNLNCSRSTCVYGIQYGDQSFSVGFFAKETLTIGKDVFPNFLFGCGQNNQGLFGRTDGLLGLGRNNISLVSQTAQKYGKVFSYCLPTSSGSNGYLRFGKGGYSSKVKFTPFSRSSAHFYFVEIKNITVGGRVVPISPSVFQTGGTIVDSGTVITRLPLEAYTALRDEFRLQMKKYKPAPALSILDTCYDFTGLNTITIPKISFFFKGKAKIDLGVNGILVAASEAQVCFAFAGSGAPDGIGIFGNIQQQTLQVVYDVAVGRLGFGPGGCS